MSHLISFSISVRIVNLYVAESYKYTFFYFFYFFCFIGYLGYTSGFSLTCMVFFVSVVGNCSGLASKQI